MGTHGILLGAALFSMACTHIDAVSGANVSGAEIQVIARMSSGVKPDHPPSNAPAVPSSTELCPQ